MIGGVSRRRTFLLAGSLIASLAVVTLAVSMWKRGAIDGSRMGVGSEEIKFEGRTFVVVEPDLRQVSIRLFWKRPDGSRYSTFENVRTQLANSHERLIFATNAGIYGRDFTPLGLHVESGQELVPLNLQEGKGNFYMQPNGVFFVDGTGPQIVRSPEYRGTHPGIRLAAQSGPMLVIDGTISPQFQPDSKSEWIRSGVGIGPDGRLVFAISREPVTFYEFASLFRSRLKCRRALYLDGTISRFWPASEKRAPSPGEFAGIIAVSRPEE